MPDFYIPPGAVADTPGTVPNAGILDPVSMGFSSWNSPPWLAGSTAAAMTPGSVYAAKIPWPYASKALTSIHFDVATVGATLSGSQIAVFNLAGTRLAAAVSADAAFTALNNQSVAMSIAASVMPSNSYFWVAFLAVGTTGPALVRFLNGTSQQVTLGATGANLPFCNLAGLTGQANIPATATPVSSNGLTAVMPFVAVK